MQFLILYDDDLSEASFRSVGKIFKIYNNFWNLKKENLSEPCSMADIRALWNFFFKVRWHCPNLTHFEHFFKVRNFSNCVVTVQTQYKYFFFFPATVNMKAAIFLLCVLSLAFCAPPDISKRSPPDISKRSPLDISKRSPPDISKRWFIDRKNANCLICCAYLYLLKSILCLHHGQYIVK